MKKNRILYFLLICFSIASFQSCNVEADFLTEVPENAVVHPILTFTAEEQGDIFEGIIDDANRVVKLRVEAWTNLSAVNVAVNVPKRATLVSPESPEGIWDLTEQKTIVVNNRKEDLTYKLEVQRKAEFIDKPIMKVTAKVDEQLFNGEINHKDKTIKINFGVVEDLTNVIVNVVTRPHVTLIAPTENTTIMDLSAGDIKEIIVNDVQKDVTYQFITKQTKVEAKRVDPKCLKVFNQGSECWETWIGNMRFEQLTDGKIMSSPDPNNKWEVDYTYFACKHHWDNNGWAALTIDAGTPIKLARFSSFRFFEEEGTQCTKFEIYRLKDGQTLTENWDAWEKLGSFDWATAENVVFTEGDVINVRYDGMAARYYRIKMLENWFVYNKEQVSDEEKIAYTFNEFGLWEYQEIE